MFNNVINAWWPLLFYSASDAPKFTKGMITLICVSVATVVITGVVWWLEKREKRANGMGMGVRGNVIDAEKQRTGVEGDGEKKEEDEDGKRVSDVKED